MNKPDGIPLIPYQQEDEHPRKAAIVPVEVDLSDVSDEDLQLIGHLMDAADAINPIFRDQYEPLTEPIRMLLEEILPHVTDEERETISHYKTMLDLQNSPYALLPRKNHLLQIPYERLQELATAHATTTPEELDAILSLMTGGVDTPVHANYYPHDITEAEFEELGKAGRRINTSLVRDGEGKLKVLLNEERYAKTLAPVIEHLRAARDLAKDPQLRLYLDAKLMELEVGSDESRRLAEYIWVRHDSPIDIVISTAMEVYLDDWKNIRGAATGGVYLRDSKSEELLAQLINHVQTWEKEAPWTYRRESINPETLPKLKFVNVLNWTGDYVTGPFTTIAQSLPNDEWLQKNIGTVNMVYSNTGKAVHSVSGGLAAKEFIPAADFEAYGDLLFDADQLHSALHEIGHTTGMQSPEAPGQPSDYLEDEYSWLEETRAELFGLYALDALVADKVIPEKEAKACYIDMLVTMVMSLRFKPVQAHTKARNAMFHYFENEGILTEVQEDGKRKFSLDLDTAPAAVREMLAMVANLKAAGDKAGVKALGEKLVREDERMNEIEDRTLDFPLGRGLIFPTLKKVDGKYTRELVYAESFSDQPKFQHQLLD